MHRQLELCLSLSLGGLAWACSEASPPTTAPSLAGASAGVAWITQVLTCPDGVKRPQLQSIYPIDDPGNLVLVGRSPCLVGSEDYQVFDLSSGAPVMVDAIDTGELGFNLGAHSPPGDAIGYGVEGAKLVVYEPNRGFSLVTIPCAAGCIANGVWAASRHDVWLGTAGAPGQILRYHRGGFRVEYEGFTVRDLWGFGETGGVIYAVGSGILRREPDGSWREVLGPAALPAACAGGFWSVHGTGPTDVWAVGSGQCVVRVSGLHWFQVAAPAGSGGVLGVWAFASGHVVLAGQGDVDLTRGLVAMWTTTDGGATWRQLSDSAFVPLPATLDASFFNLAATADGSRILAPSIGGTLLIGQAGVALVGQPAAAATAGAGAAAAMVPEQ